MTRRWKFVTFLTLSCWIGIMGKATRRTRVTALNFPKEELTQWISV